MCAVFCLVCHVRLAVTMHSASWSILVCHIKLPSGMFLSRHLPLWEFLWSSEKVSFEQAYLSTSGLTHFLFGDRVGVCPEVCLCAFFCILVFSSWHVEILEAYSWSTYMMGLACCCCCCGCGCGGVGGGGNDVCACVCVCVEGGGGCYVQCSDLYRIF